MPTDEGEEEDNGDQKLPEQQSGYQSAKDLLASQDGVNFIARREGFRGKVYLDGANNPTIGFGHKLGEGESFPNGITREEALELLRNDIGAAESAVQRYVTIEINQPQFDALTSITFNVGGGAFRRSTLLRLLNQGDYIGAADQFLVWDKIRNAQGVLRSDPGLANRRNLERDLFLNGRYQ